MIQVKSRGAVQTCLGPAEQLKINTPEYRPLGWREVWEAFAVAYPGRWAVQVFPPADQLVDSKSVYHLWVLEKEPDGMNLRG